MRSQQVRGVASARSLSPARLNRRDGPVLIWNLERKFLRARGFLDQLYLLLTGRRWLGQVGLRLASPSGACRIAPCQTRSSSNQALSPRERL